jgi:hypothetical protein
MDATLADLRSRYGDPAVSVRQAPGTTLLKVAGVRIPRRNGVQTDVLLELPDGCLARGERPRVYVADGTTQPNGRRGRNVNPTMVHGENWLTFSWSFEWSPSQPAWALVEGAVRRFTVDED